MKGRSARRPLAALTTLKLIREAELAFHACVQPSGSPTPALVKRSVRDVTSTSLAACQSTTEGPLGKVE